MHSLDEGRRRRAAAVSLILVFGWLLGWAGPVPAAQGDPGTVVLSPGIIVQGQVFRRDGTSVPSVTTGVDANTYVRTTPPTESFLGTAPATVVYTTQPDQFVRFYTDGTTGAIGSFATRARDIRGLTPAQIRDVLALPYLPDHLTIIKAPVGTCILNGIAGPILGNFPANPPAIPTPGPWGAVSSSNMSSGGPPTQIVRVPSTCRRTPT